MASEHLGNPIYFNQKFNQYDRIIQIISDSFIDNNLRLQRIEENLSRINKRLSRPGTNVPNEQKTSRPRPRPRASKKKNRKSKKSRKYSNKKKNK